MSDVRVRKYDYLFVLQGDYGYGDGWEDLTAVDKSESRAWQQIVCYRKDYRVNEGGSYRIVSCRELVSVVAW